MQTEIEEPVPANVSINKLMDKLRDRKHLDKVHDEIVGVAFDLNDFVHELPSMADDMQIAALDKNVSATREVLKLLLNLHQTVVSMELLIRHGLQKAAER